MNLRKSVSFVLRILLLKVVIISNHMTLTSTIDPITVIPKSEEVNFANLYFSENLIITKQNNPDDESKNMNLDKEEYHDQESVLKNTNKEIKSRFVTIDLDQNKFDFDNENNEDRSKTTVSKLPTLYKILKDNVYDNGTWKTNDGTNDTAKPSEHLMKLPCTYKPREYVLEDFDNEKIKTINNTLLYFIKKGIEKAKTMLHAKNEEIEKMNSEKRNLASTLSHGRQNYVGSRSSQMDFCGGYAVIETANYIVKEYIISKKKADAMLSKINVTSYIDKLFENCTSREVSSDPVNCSETSLYRTFTGKCNNLQNKNWGASFTSFARFLPTNYSDGYNSMSEGLKDLPNPRNISRSLADILKENTTDIHVTQMLKAWGQFIDHDLIFTLGGQEKCCDVQTVDPNITSECRPIDVKNDKHFKEMNVKCLSFVRSLPAGKRPTLAPREQINAITAFVDSSNVYGSTDEEAKNLRADEGGRLKENDLGENKNCKSDRTSLCYPFLPKINNSPSYLAGDIRVNEQPGLIAMHTLMLRFHNKVADALNKKHKNKTDIYDNDKLFEETRRIVIACAQHITYNEFLRVLLGKDYINKYNLSSSSEYKYDETLDPSIRNEFATFALRMGHTLIGKQITGKKTINLENAFGKPWLTENSSLYPSDVLKGECTNPSEKFDMKFVDTVVNDLFLNAPASFGSDLFALNIQRGRDHGLPSYNEVRNFCCKRNFSSWEDMASELNPKAVKIFEDNYGSVNDVDVFPGAISEPRTTFGFIGDTFSCILAKQFNYLKFGDRFWYENEVGVQKFKPEQISVIENVTLSSIICATSNIKTIQPFPMLSSTLKGNEEKNCEDIVNNFNLISQIEEYF